MRNFSANFAGQRSTIPALSSNPDFLKKGGAGFGGLKHLLELLRTKFGKFTLTFTPQENSIKRDGDTVKVRISAQSVNRMAKRLFDSRRTAMVRLASTFLAETFPEEFHGAEGEQVYRRGMFASVLTADLDPRIVSIEDREALTKFLTTSLLAGASSFDVPTAYKSTKSAELLYLEKLVNDFDGQLDKGRDESWWQRYFGDNILFFQSNYISRVEKINVAIAGTKFPDFIVATSDGYLDIIEIKKPATELLKEDSSRHNFYWSSEIAKAISQVENYIDRVTKHSDAIRNALRDNYNLDLRVIKPRGIVIAGRVTQFSMKPKMSDDFRLLNEGLKNTVILPYDELSSRVRNNIVSINRLATEKGAK